MRIIVGIGGGIAAYKAAMLLRLFAKNGDEVIAMRAGSIMAHGRPEEVVTAEMVEEVFGLAAVIAPHPVARPPPGTPPHSSRSGEPACISTAKSAASPN